MNDSATNSHEPPKTNGRTATAAPSAQSLRPLWIWLAMAVLFSWGALPVHPLYMLVALGYGVFSFCSGSIYRSSVSLYSE